MTAREKLYELFQDVACPDVFIENWQMMQLANYLVANGVTFATDTNVGSKVETNVYDVEEIHHNCTVQILTNSVTGEQSIGWWKENEPPKEV